MGKHDAPRYRLPRGWTPLRFETAVRIYDYTKDRGYVFDIAFLRKLFPYMSRISLFRRLQGLKMVEGIEEYARGTYRLKPETVRLVEEYYRYLREVGLVAQETVEAHIGEA